MSTMKAWARRRTTTAAAAGSAVFAVVAMVAVIGWSMGLAACNDGRAHPSGDGSVGKDVALNGDATTNGDGSSYRDGAPHHDGQVPGDAAPSPDGAAPGTDPCSGNAFTPTTASTGQGQAPGDASSVQIEAMHYTNSFRNLCGLNPINFNSALDSASQAHSDYCSTDSSWCPGWHQEQEGHPGFTGVNFWERDQYAGYSGQPASEVMAPGGTPQYAIDMWMESVYHRTPFVNPKIHEAGFGSGSSYTTMDFGCCGSFDANLVTNYPVHGQTGVPTDWLGNEGPQPPTPPTGWPSGPVISIIFPPGANVGITAHQIYDDTCQTIEHVAGGQGIQPDPGFQGSFLGSTVAMYPNNSLASHKTYTVNVEYTMGGQPGHRTFSFTTK